MFNSWITYHPKSLPGMFLVHKVRRSPEHTVRLWIQTLFPFKTTAHRRNQVCSLPVESKLHKRWILLTKSIKLLYKCSNILLSEYTINFVVDICSNCAHQNNNCKLKQTYDKKNQNKYFYFVFKECGVGWVVRSDWVIGEGILTLDESMELKYCLPKIIMNRLKSW